jgi:hypothetical protein
MNLSNLTEEQLLKYDEDTFDNWFSKDAQGYFEKYLEAYKNQPNLHFVQLGAYRGHASKWLMENILTHPTSNLTDIDCWIDVNNPYTAKEHDTAELTYRTYLARTEPYKDCITVIKDFTMSAVDKLKNNSYDFVYVDADHTASAVLLDGAEYWKKLKPNGIMAFDDYTWFVETLHPLFTPKLGIDEFLKGHQDELQLLTLGHQVWIRKN